MKRILHSLVGTFRSAVQHCLDAVALAQSRRIDISDCQTVCLALGPYRNLTTLTASVLFLHPHCQVLNHAGNRIFGRRAIDFFSEFHPERLERFLQFAIRISTDGKRGSHGGSITHSHAFEEHRGIKQLHEQAGGALLKPHIRCLFWKESLHTANHIRSTGFDWEDAFRRDGDRLRFLSPIRNPMDCAVSNLKTGLARHFLGLPNRPTPRDVTAAVLKELAWFCELQARFPTRFLYFFEHEVSDALLTRLALFVKLDPLPSWLNAAQKAMRVEGGYVHDAELVQFYEREVVRLFAPYPAVREGLLKFRETGRTVTNHAA